MSIEEKIIKCPHCASINLYMTIVCTVCGKPIGRKFDEDKTVYWFLPWSAIEAIARVMMFGAKKYAVNNWQQIDDPKRYINALYRHLNAWCEGEKNDKDSGFSHLWHVGCNALFIIWMELKGKLNCTTEE